MTSVNPYSAPNANTASVYSDETYQPAVFSFNGRIGRLRYLAYSLAWGLVVLAVIAVGLVLTFAGIGSDVGVLTAVGGLITIVGYVGSVVTSFVIAIRRLNDTNNSGWLSLLMLVPLVNLAFILYLLFASGTQGENNYGLAPSENSTGVIIAALAIPVFVVVVGILAAIAVPAYQDYVNRAAGAQELQFPE